MVPSYNDSNLSCRVMVIEDNPDTAKTLSMLLSLGGHQVEIAYDGLSALDIARSFLPEVVLLDIGLPGIDGYKVAHLLRNELQIENLLIVALTGWGQAADRQRAMEAGFDIHLTKPANPVEIENLINQFKTNINNTNVGYNAKSAYSEKS